VLLLLRGEHDIDLQALDLPPVTARSGMRTHCKSYATVWRKVAAHCLQLAGPDRMLINTTERAIETNRALNERLERAEQLP
jgi:hypothetical protein